MSRLEGRFDTAAVPVCISDGENNFLLVPKAFRARAVAEGIHRHSLGIVEVTRSAPYKGLNASEFVGLSPCAGGHAQVRPTTIPQSSSSVAQLGDTSSEAGTLSAICIHMKIKDLF